MTNWIIELLSSVAQLVEQRTSNPKVVGSSPTWATEFFNNSVGHYQCRLSSLMSPFLIFNDNDYDVVLF